MDISGSNYQILNSASYVIHTSTSSSAAFNWLLGNGGHASSGSTVYIYSGSYTLDATWIIDVSSVTVTCQSGVVITAIPFGGPSDGSGGQPLLNVWGNNVIVDGGVWDGNGQNQEPYQYSNVNWKCNNLGPCFYGTNDLIEYATVRNIRMYGINAGWGGGNGLGVVGCTVYNVGANGIMFQTQNAGGPNNIYVENCEVYHCSDCAIDLGGYNGVCTGCYVHDIGDGWSTSSTGLYGYGNGGNGAFIPGTYWGICSEYGTGTGNGNYYQITGNTINNVQNTAICISQSGASAATGFYQNYWLIAGNTVNNCGCAGGAYAAIDVEWSYGTIIEYNTVNNCLIGVGLDYYAGHGLSQNCYIYDNSFSGCTTTIVNNGVGTSYSVPSPQPYNSTST